MGNSHLQALVALSRKLHRINMVKLANTTETCNQNNKKITRPKNSDRLAPTFQIMLLWGPLVLYPETSSLVG